MTRLEPMRRTPFAAGCRWIEGSARGRAFDADLYCDAETVPNKPYCAEHCARAYRPVETP